MAFYIYIAACHSNTAIYIGVTANLQRRMMEHHAGDACPHTAKYRIRKLVYYEAHQSLPDAIARERKLKRWRRAWKNALIEDINPNWSDLIMDTSFL